MNLEIGFFEAMLLAYINESTILGTDNKIIINPEKVIEFINKCYFGINKLLNDFVIDNSYNNKITELFNKTVFNILEIPQEIN